MPKKVGKPPKYNNLKQLQTMIDKYFLEETGIKVLKDETGNIIYDAKGQPVTYLKPPTTCGLAAYLGFLDRRSLVDYSEKDEYSPAIKAARLKCELFAEEQLYINAHPVGAIFALKNRGWQDKQIVQHEGVDSFISLFRGEKEKI